MKHNLPTIALLVITATAPLALAESAYERDLKQFKDQRDKAIAAANEPINRRYKESLEQLLRKATQASELDTALKIKSELQSLGSTSGTAGTPTSEAHVSKGKVQALQRKLQGTKWISDVPAMFGVTELNFTDTKAKYGKTGAPPTGNVAFRVADDGSILLVAISNGQDQKLTISDDFKTLTWGQANFTSK